MYEIKENQCNPSNFHRGFWPAKMGTGTIKAGAVIRARVPVVEDDDGYLVEAADDTLEALVGLSSAEPSGDQLVYYMTGDFYGPEVVLPDGVDYAALKKRCRKLSIFLSE